jgi:hypothetical protein
MEQVIKIPSWGVLGNPTREKIREYSNMPVGQFKNMVKDLSRKTKGKKITMHKVYVEKRVSESYVEEIEVAAVSATVALSTAQVRNNEISWSDVPDRTEYNTYHYTTYDPRKMWDYNRSKTNES